MTDRTTYNLQWREENAEHLREYRKAYQKKNREKRNAYLREWRKKNRKGKPMRNQSANWKRWYEKNKGVRLMLFKKNATITKAAVQADEKQERLTGFAPAPRPVSGPCCKTCGKTLYHYDIPRGECFQHSVTRTRNAREGLG